MLSNLPLKSFYFKSLARIIHEPKKPTEEGALWSRMILKTAVSQEHHNPKPRASVVLVQYQSVSWSRSGAMRPDSPLGLTTSSWHMSPRRVQRSFTGPARSNARQQGQTAPQNWRHRA